MSTATPVLRQLCEGQLPEHWDTGSTGNRLALAICGQCPGTPGCGDGDPAPAGVIRAGVPYDDTGRALPVGDCGYPHQYDTPCRLCVIPAVPIPDPQRILRWQVRDLYLDGWTDTRIARHLHRATRTIQTVRTSAGWAKLPAHARPPCLCGCGQKVRKTGAQYIQGHRSAARRNSTTQFKEQAA